MREDYFGFQEIGSLVPHGRIVYQGERGAYTQEAMHHFFGSDIDAYNVVTWRDVFEEIRLGNAEYGVLPYENSSAGIISDIFDLMGEYGYYIVGEQVIEIDHCLMALPGASFEGLTTIYSHPHALAQCSRFFEEHRSLTKQTAYNTALAAKFVSEQKDWSIAAIAGRASAQIYGLQILQEAIQNHRGNQTRFIIVGKEAVYLRGAGKITLGLQLKHEAGALYHALEVFYRYGINMTSIESRPIPGHNWEYYFFVDVEGSLKNDKVRIALELLQKQVAKLHIFGNY